MHAIKENKHYDHNSSNQQVGVWGHWAGLDMTKTSDEGTCSSRKGFKCTIGFRPHQPLPHAAMTWLMPHHGLNLPIKCAQGDQPLRRPNFFLGLNEAFAVA